ncbi:3-hydroxyacyl-CoA dehydrogenase NAD-binding domain-containing protein [Nocardia sp. NBC_01377]|uniref:3-hydroxyacyl-CoA dehydrogenase family protein n=1 Tax=Nocardia sp. NBC_01377 TaxID=2903595 RepID=UPI003245C2EF
MPQPAAEVVPPRREALDALAGLLRDAILLAERGTASGADIDAAMRLGAGHRQGPLELIATLDPDERREFGITWTPPAVAPGPVEVAAVGADWTGSIGILGSGHMATGIAEAVTRSGREVIALTRSPESGERVRDRLAASLTRASERGRLGETAATDALARLRTTGDAADLSIVDVVVEAVAEDLDVKAAVLSELDRAIPTHVPVATNTSSFEVADLRPFLTAERPVLALHFFNPAAVMKLVEVVVPDDVVGAESLRSSAGSWVRAIGKTPVTCADSRGFIVNRLLIPFLNDAVRLHESGRGVDEVDELLRRGAEHPMGPLALIDLIGIDVTIAALESMAAVDDDPRLSPAETLRELAGSGRLGRKTGAGFHTYR